MENSVVIIHAISTAYTCFYFTGSQEGGGGTAPREVTGSHPLLEPAAQDLVQAAFGYLQEWRFHTQKTPDHVKHLTAT